MSAVKTDQSEGIPGAGIPEQAVKKMPTGSAALSLPSPFTCFRALFLNSHFPHYLGAWNRLIQATLLESENYVIIEIMLGLWVRSDT